MNALTDSFNTQAHWHWSTFIAPLLILLILDDENRRNRRKRERLDHQFRRFAAISEKKSRQQYVQPQYRVTSPHF